MSIMAEDHQPLWYPGLGDLFTWYSAFEVFAASSTAKSTFFHGPHVAAPVDLERVRQGLEWLETTHGDGLKLHPLPTLDHMRTELMARGRAGAGTVRSLDSGSPSHNFWHWLHG